MEENKKKLKKKVSHQSLEKFEIRIPLAIKIFSLCSYLQTWILKQCLFKLVPRDGAYQTDSILAIYVFVLLCKNKKNGHLKRFLVILNPVSWNTWQEINIIKYVKYLNSLYSNNSSQIWYKHNVFFVLCKPLRNGYCFLQKTTLIKSLGMKNGIESGDRWNQINESGGGGVVDGKTWLSK